MGLSLRKRGIKRVKGYGFATPPCMIPELAKECQHFFTDAAFRDDVVSRFGPQAVAKLHGELRKYDWEAAAEVSEASRCFICMWYLTLISGFGGNPREHCCRPQTVANELWCTVPSMHGSEAHT